MQRPRPKRAYLVHHIGKQVLKHVKTYELKNPNNLTPVTAARQYVRKHKIKGPAILLMRRTQFTIDRFYWCEWGMFSAQYVECNYTNFAYLRELSKQLIEQGIIDNNLLSHPDSELENFNCEYLFA